MRPQQVLVLGLILLVPVLAFLFLKSFGTNRYALPTFLPERVDSTQANGKWQRDTVYHQIGDFHFSSQVGREITGAELRENGLYVSSFFSTTCQTCQRMNSQLVRVQEKFRQEPRMRIASFTLMPAQDSVLVLQRYAEEFGAISGKWFFLTGDKRSLHRLITEEFRLPNPVGPSSEPIHNHELFLVDSIGHVRGHYDGTKEREVNRLITEIEVLLYTYDHP